MGVTDEDGDAKPSAEGTNWFEQILTTTEQVRLRLDSDLRPHGAFPFILLGMFPNATARIIQQLGAAQQPQDHAAMFHASRFVTTATGAYLLMMRGLVTEANVLLRTLFEVTAQFSAMMADSAMAASWATGKRFSPRVVRDRLPNGGELRELYGILSEFSHANWAATGLHSFRTGRGYAIAYGGSYRPKIVGGQLYLLGRLTLDFLDAFYAHYRDSLSLDGWPIILRVGRAGIEELSSWADALPPDEDELARWVSKHANQTIGQIPSYPPELLEQIRTESARLEHESRGPERPDGG